MKTISQATKFYPVWNGKAVTFYNNSFESKENLLKNMYILHKKRAKKLYTSYKKTYL